ncbi:MAG: hypothetical protein HGB17_00125 [Syntrophobacteraceae bacterium]|nr:hypothetical protein [Syntrophobacteraceae bacterium]
MTYSATWTAKRVNAYLANITGGDAYVEQGWKNGKAQTKAKKCSHGETYQNEYGYICVDSYRPGMRFWGKTPKAACIAAGFDGILAASDATYA